MSEYLLVLTLCILVARHDLDTFKFEPLRYVIERNTTFACYLKIFCSMELDI